MFYDIIVVGFGTAGAMAAIKASESHSVLVIEKNSYPGGMQTGGFIREYCYQPPSGLGLQLEQRSNELYADGDFCNHIAPKIIALEEKAIQNGVTIQYESVIKNITNENGVVKEIEWINGTDTYTAKCSTLIDATAEGIPCLLAGCEFISGRKWDGRYQHSTVMFEFKKNGKEYVNSGNGVRVNQENISDFSLHTMKAAADIIKQNNPEFRITLPADHAGIREGRHILSDKVYTINDYILDDNKIENPVYYSYSQFDTNITDISLESDDFQDWMIAAIMWGTKLFFPISMKSMFPKNMKNIIVAGRHLGVDHDVGHALRMNAAMSALGEVAGIIAQASLKDQIMPHQVEYAMTSDSLNLPDLNEVNNDDVWNISEEQFIKVLNSDTLGKAIWNAYKHNKKDLLYSIIENNSDGSNIFVHAVFALALLKEESVKPYLYRLIENKDNTQIFSEDFDYGLNAASVTVYRATIAIYLVGRFADIESIDLLANILKDNKLQHQSVYHSYSIMALLKIGNINSDCCKKVSDILQNKFSDDSWAINMRFIKYLPEECDFLPHYKDVVTHTISNW